MNITKYIKNKLNYKSLNEYFSNSSIEKNSFDSNVLKKMEEDIKIEATKYKTNNGQKNVLYVSHGLGGGVGFAVRDIIKEIDKNFNCFVLISRKNKMELYNFINETFKLTYSWDLEKKWNGGDFNLKQHENIYFTVLNSLNIDILHIHHLLRQTFDLPKVAHTLNIPVILSLHDYYLLCPSYHLLDGDYNYCNGFCENSNSKTCKTSPICGFDEKLNLKDFLQTWGSNVSKMLKCIDVFVYTSKTTKDLFTAVYPEVKNKEFVFIEHGRNFKTTDEKLYEIPSNKKPIKILFSNVREPSKGVELIKNIKDKDINSRLEFHFIGTTDPELQEYGYFHGKFERNTFCEKVKEINPSFMGIFSICPETYCYVLSEAWTCGIPVLTTKLGALKERTIENKGGWFIDYSNPDHAYNQILDIADNIEEYNNIQHNVLKIKFKTREEMGDDYLKLYNRVYDVNHS